VAGDGTLRIVDLRRLRAGEWIAGLSGAALVVVLFVPWYGAEGTSVTASAWESFAVNDAILLLAALFAVALWAAAATQRTTAVPNALASLTLLLGLIATILVLVRLASAPGGDGVTREYGVWLGLAACLGILFGAYRAMANETTPGVAAPKIEATPLPPPRPEGE
jgi:hypothetical protein